MKKVAADSLSLSLSLSLSPWFPGSPITAGNQPACLSRLRGRGHGPPSARVFFAAARSGLRRRAGGSFLAEPSPRGKRRSPCSRRALPTLSRLGSAPLGGQVRGGRSPLHEIARASLSPFSAESSFLHRQRARSQAQQMRTPRRGKEKSALTESFRASADLSSHFVAASLAFFSSGVGGSLVPDHKNNALDLECGRGKAGEFCARAAAGASASSHFSLKKVCWPARGSETRRSGGPGARVSHPSSLRSLGKWKP